MVKTGGLQSSSNKQETFFLVHPGLILAGNNFNCYRIRLQTKGQNTVSIIAVS